jgi:hypothetical protein
MAKNKFDKAFEDMKSGKIKGPTNDDSGPLPKGKKEYKDYDRSTPEKRGYAVRKAIINSSDNEYQRDKSNALGNDMFNTGPERNIGPRMDSESFPASKQKLPGLDETESKARSGKWQAGYDKAKAETENVGPEMKKGGKVKAKKMAKGGKVSQLAKANGCAVRGKTRGKIC